MERVVERERARARNRERKRREEREREGGGRERERERERYGEEEEEGVIKVSNYYFCRSVPKLLNCDQKKQKKVALM